MIRASLMAAHARGYLHYFGSNVVQQGLAFATMLVVAALLPPQEFALVRIAQAYLAVLLIVGTAGVTAPLLRYCADPSYSSDDRRRLLGRSLSVAAAISAAVTSLCLLLTVLRFPENSAERTVFLGYALQLPALVAASIALVYLQALQSFRSLAVSQLAMRGLTFVAVTLAALAAGLAGLVVAMLAAVYANVLLMAWLAPTLRPLRGERHRPADFSKLARYSVFGMLVSALGQSSDLILLDALGVDRTAIGVYSLAALFLVAAGALVGTAQGVATPAFTALMHAPDEFRRKLLRWTVAMAAVGVVSSVVVYGFAWGLERWLLGDRYAGFSSLLGLLLVKFALWATYAIGGAALVGIGEIRKGSYIAVATTGLSFVAGVPLIMAFGVWGAAIAQVGVALVAFALIGKIILAELSRLDTAVVSVQRERVQ
jgi:O-antigen/teichoic acid export membrane protein